MNKFYNYILNKIDKKIVIQGTHKNNIIIFYSYLIKAAKSEFTEDSHIELKKFLDECHNEAFDNVRDKYRYAQPYYELINKEFEI